MKCSEVNLDSQGAKSNGTSNHVPGVTRGHRVLRHMVRPGYFIEYHPLNGFHNPCSHWLGGSIKWSASDKGAALSKHEVYNVNYLSLRKADGETMMPVYSLPSRSDQDWY